MHHRKKRKRHGKPFYVAVILLECLTIAALIMVIIRYLNPFTLKWSRYKVANCGEDEDGNYTGGEAGDQYGNEWEVRPWKDADWTCILRYPDEDVAADIAAYARAAAENDLIGYNQEERGDFWMHLEASNYDPSQITIPCNTDCSSSTASIIKAVGYKDSLPGLQRINIEMTTWNMADALSYAGFEVIRDPEYLESPRELLPGDIILSEGEHVCIML